MGFDTIEINLVIIYSLKQNNLYFSYPSNIQIISQEQLYVDIFSTHGQTSPDQEEPQCLCFRYLDIRTKYWISKQTQISKYPSFSEYIVFEGRLSLTTSEIKTTSKMKTTSNMMTTSKMKTSLRMKTTLKMKTTSKMKRTSK